MIGILGHIRLGKYFTIVFFWLLTLLLSGIFKNRHFFFRTFLPNIFFISDISVDYQYYDKV